LDIRFGVEVNIHADVGCETRAWNQNLAGRRAGFFERAIEGAARASLGQSPQTKKTTSENAEVSERTRIRAGILPPRLGSGPDS